MARSAWKLPFVDKHLFRLLSKDGGLPKRKIIKVRSRRSTIWPNFKDNTFLIYNGKTFIEVTITEGMIGHKFGEFAPTRTFKGHPGSTLNKKVVKRKV